MSVTSALSRQQAIDRILHLTARPTTTAGTPWLVVTAGLPGSGKSTFCRKLARATNAVILESDGLRAALFATPSHTSDESRQLFDALYGAAEHLLAAGATVIVDATNLRERDRQRAFDLAETTGARLLLLHFRASRRTIAERLANRGNGLDPDDRSTAGIAVYDRMAETEEPIRREHWKIDTSDPAATEAALHRAIDTLTPQSPAEGRNTGGSIS